MANAIVHSRPPSYRSHQSDHEIVVPQTNSEQSINTNITPQRDQPPTSTGSSQVLSTTAQINHNIDSSQVDHISNSNTSQGSSYEMPSKINDRDRGLNDCKETRDSPLVSNQKG